MTKTIFQNWKVIAGLSIAVVLLGSALTVGMFTPKAEASHDVPGFCASDPSTGATVFVAHWDKIIFQILRDPSGDIDPRYLKTPLDIKVTDDPGKVSNLVMKVKAFIAEHGIATVTGDFDPTIVPQLKIDIIDVEYAIVCINPLAADG